MVLQNVINENKDQPSSEMTHSILYPSNGGFAKVALPNPDILLGVLSKVSLNNLGQTLNNGRGFAPRPKVAQ